MIRSTYRAHTATRKAAAKALRRRIEHVLVAATIRFLATGTLVTITTALGKLTDDEDLLRRYASHAGRKVKAAYVALTGVAPVQVWTARNGHPYLACAYNPADPALTVGFGAYKRTAHLVGA
ncbi:MULTISPECIES: hypothetical protein [Nocardia]|uniref:hypothetical protein n=1 Tax=Nocardia TaxID=1817 RepID=UPI000D68D4A4|nr:MULTISPECIES: hypothetical protein [Nocardia]